MLETKPVENVYGLECTYQEDKTFTCSLKDKDSKNIDTYRDVQGMEITKSYKTYIEALHIDFHFDNPLKCFLKLGKNRKIIICK